MTTAADLLEAANEAILACMKSQEYQIANRRQQRAMLRDLIAARAEFAREVQESGNSGSMASLGEILRPS